MSKAAQDIETARRAYVASIGTRYAGRAYLNLCEVVQRVKRDAARGE